MERQERELQVSDSERFSRGEAIGERIGWLLMAVAVAAAVLGLFANGPLSHRRVESDDLSVQYQRFARNQGFTSLEVEAQPTAASEGKVEVWVDQEFLESYDLEQVRPEPESTSTRAGGVVFAFAVDGNDTPVKAKFNLQPQHSGPHRAAVAVGGGRPARFTQFVYP